MPIIKREIVNPLAIANPELYEDSTEDSSLDDTNIAALTGILGQIGYLASYATELLDGLFRIADEVQERIVMVTSRTKRLNEQLKDVEELVANASLEKILSKHLKLRRVNEITVPTIFTKLTNCDPIRSNYDLANPPPALYKLDDIFPDRCMDKYSYPQFFFQEWLKAERARQEKEKIERRAQKAAKKKLKLERMAASGAVLEPSRSGKKKSSGIKQREKVVDDFEAGSADRYKDEKGKIAVGPRKLLTQQSSVPTPMTRTEGSAVFDDDMNRDSVGHAPHQIPDTDSVDFMNDRITTEETKQAILPPPAMALAPPPMALAPPVVDITNRPLSRMPSAVDVTRPKEVTSLTKPVSTVKPEPQPLKRKGSIFSKMFGGKSKDDVASKGRDESELETKPDASNRGLSNRQLHIEEADEVPTDEGLFPPSPVRRTGSSQNIKADGSVEVSASSQARSRGFAHNRQTSSVAVDDEDDFVGAPVRRSFGDANQSSSHNDDQSAPRNHPLNTIRDDEYSMAKLDNQDAASVNSDMPEAPQEPAVQAAPRYDFPDWEEAFDPNSGRVYYVNYQTKQSCWEDPKVTGIVPELPKIPTPPPLPPIKTSAMFSKFATDDQPLSPDSAAADWRSDIQRGRTLNTAVKVKRQADYRSEMLANIKKVNLSTLRRVDESEKPKANERMDEAVTRLLANRTQIAGSDDDDDSSDEEEFDDDF